MFFYGCFFSACKPTLEGLSHDEWLLNTTMTANFVFQLLQWGIDSNVVNDEGHTALEEVNLFTSSNASSEIKHILKGKFVISPKRKVEEGLVVVHLHTPVNNYIAK